MRQLATYAQYGRPLSKVLGDPTAPKTGTKIAPGSTAELLKDHENPTTITSVSVLMSALTIRSQPKPSALGVVKVQALHLLSARLGPRTAPGQASQS